MNELQSVSFQIISCAGDAKCCAYEALEAAKQNNKELFEDKMLQAEEIINEAHKLQYQLLSAEADNKLHESLSILIVHAQDHLMTTMSVIDMIKEVSNLYLLMNAGQVREVKS